MRSLRVANNRPFKLAGPNDLCVAHICFFFTPMHHQPLPLCVALSFVYMNTNNIFQDKIVYLRMKRVDTFSSTYLRC